jgi:hypothetical protein
VACHIVVRDIANGGDGITLANAGHSTAAAD